MVPQHFAVITGVYDEGVFQLSGFLQGFHDATKLIIDQFYDCVIGGLQSPGVPLFNYGFGVLRRIRLSNARAVRRHRGVRDNRVAHI